MKKRDAAYWRGRLERDHPKIAKKLKDGKIPSVRAAAIEAGLIRAPTPLDELRRAWRKASADQRKAFGAEAGVEAPPPPRAKPARKAAKPDASAGVIPEQVERLVRAVFPPDVDAGDEPDEVLREFMMDISLAIRNVIDYGAEWGDEEDLPDAQKAVIEDSIRQLTLMLGEDGGARFGLTGVEVAKKLKGVGITVREAASIAGVTQQAMKGILTMPDPLPAHARQQIEPLLTELRDYE